MRTLTVCKWEQRSLRGVKNPKFIEPATRKGKLVGFYVRFRGRYHGFAVATH